MQGNGDTADRFWYVCAVCGIFCVTTQFLYALPEKETAEGERLYKLSYQFRLASQNCRQPNELPLHLAAEIPILLSQSDPSVQTKTELLLSHLGRISSYPGEDVKFDYSTDYPLISAQNNDEVKFFIKSLSSQGLLELNEYESEAQEASVCRLTTDGWKELDRINQSGPVSSNAFIAMWFDKDRDPFEQAISAAVRAAGYLPVRVDKIEHVNHVDDEILARIRGSKFLISDFTGQRHGVYFEAGFMLGLGRPVIWVCEKKDLKNVHFDTRQYNTIDYADAEDLRTRLQFRIEAILGKGPHAEQ
jgi:hypothetical protein